MRYQPYEEPIEIPQFFFTRDMYDLICDVTMDDEERGQFLRLVAKWALFNVLDTKYAEHCSGSVREAVNRAIAMMYSGLNKYRWDYANGSKGGRPKGIPKL